MTAIATKTWHQIANVGNKNQLSVPTAFGQDIFLLSTSVAGVQYHEGVEDLDGWKPGIPLTLRRDPKNEYDDLAIQVISAKGRQVGHVPRAENPILARLMDAGKSLSAKLESIHRKGGWSDVRFSVYMQNI